jgi:hypothetical protein
VHFLTQARERLIDRANDALQPIKITRGIGSMRSGEATHEGQQGFIGARLSIAVSASRKFQPFRPVFIWKDNSGRWWSISDAGVCPPQKQHIGCCLRNSPVFAI